MRFGAAAVALGLAAPGAAAQDPAADLGTALRDRSASARAGALERVRPEAAAASGGTRLVARIEGALGDPAPIVRLAAARALGRIRPPGSAAALRAAVSRERDPEAAEAAARSLGAVAGREDVGALLAALSGGPAPARSLACAALGACRGDPRAGEALRRALSGDGEWAVRASAALALGERAEADALPLLARRLDTDHPAVRVAAGEALERATGLRLGADAAAWRRAAEEGRLRPGAAPPDPAVPSEPSRPGQSVPVGAGDRWAVTYWGVPVVEAGVVFLLDTSASMNFYGRLRDARRELTATLSALPSAVRVGLLLFNDEARWAAPRLLPATPLAKLALLERVEEAEGKRYTDLLGALERAFGAAGAGRFPLDPPERVGALFLLTDGIPSRWFVRDPAAIREAVARWNPGRRTAIHAVGLGEDRTEFLRALAEENRGRYIAPGR
ncbi:MAG: HEAT repeat domain-containing protein [Planctomycetales bacterium]|nr:HEAT repeat domain-containing protein [Planctomycetales bacterium]